MSTRLLRLVHSISGFLVLVVLLIALFMIVKPNLHEGDYYWKYNSRGISEVSCGSTGEANYTWDSVVFLNGNFVNIHTLYDVSMFKTGGNFVFTVEVPAYQERFVISDYSNATDSFDPGSVFLANYPGSGAKFIQDLNRYYNFEALTASLKVFYNENASFCILFKNPFGRPA